MKTERDWREVDKRMSQTLEIRRKMIGGQTPLKDILKMFPFLKCPYQVSDSPRKLSILGNKFIPLLTLHPTHPTHPTPLHLLFL